MSGQIVCCFIPEENLSNVSPTLFACHIDLNVGFFFFPLFCFSSWKLRSEEDHLY